jgi:heme a synthase
MRTHSTSVQRRWKRSYTCVFSTSACPTTISISRNLLRNVSKPTSLLRIRGDRYFSTAPFESGRGLASGVASSKNSSENDHSTQQGETFVYVDPSHQRFVIVWLLGTAALVFVMVVIGGITRLTESGLSIADWRPVTGAIPPMTEQDWMVEFEKYKQTPEFKKLNSSMTVEDFKGIYFWEWFHRLFGRAIGVAFALPFFYLLSRRVLRTPLTTRLSVLLLLGGSQGALGWYMVKSGLEVKDGEVPRVSQYRLAAHLGSAFAIYTGLLWTAMDVMSKNRPSAVTSVQAILRSPAAPKLLRFGASAVLGMTFVTAMSGAFVAGLDAGMVYNEFPWMGWHSDAGPRAGQRRYVPEEYWSLEPSYSNFFDNSAAVQFNHRWLAIGTLTMINLLWLFTKQNSAARAAVSASPALRKSIHAAGMMSWLQVALGVTTLLWVVPIPLAATHQAGSLVLLSTCTWLRHVLTRH